MAYNQTVVTREASQQDTVAWMIGWPVMGQKRGNMTAVGSRVTAILEAKDGVVRSFGDGVYAGDFDLPPQAVGCNLGQKNPRIDLDSGKTVWGCESWWGPCEAVRKRLPADWKWEIVDIDAHRESNK